MNFQSSPRRGLTYSNLNGNGDAPSRASIGAKWPANLINSIRHAARPWSAASPKTQDEPIRAELFSIERLEQHAETLAAAQSTTSKPTTNRRLAKRLRDNDGALRAAYRATVVAVREERTITPAAHWLVDNFHNIQKIRGFVDQNF